MDKVYILGQMVTNIKVNGKKTKEMEKAFFNNKTEINLKDYGKMMQ